jgi:hypothetical protein
MFIASLCAAAQFTVHPVTFSEVTFTPRGDYTSTGFSFVQAEKFVSLPDAAEPNLPNSFAVGIDLSNPKETNPFNANGNIYGRPEREISIHFNGVEIDNRYCPSELRNQPIWVRLENVTGGSLVSVRAGSTKVYDRFFLRLLNPPIAGGRLPMPRAS